VTSIACTIPAIATTTYRLWIRRGRYWADDAWALCSALCQIVLMTGTLVHTRHSSPKAAKIATYYLMASSFYGVIWFARLSILFSIIRIDPSATRRRRLLIVAVSFFLLSLVLVCQLFWTCEPAPSWKDEGNLECPLDRQVAISQIVTDVLSDTILIVAPLRLLRTLHDKRLRRRLTMIFSTCLITTAVSLVHAALIFLHGGPKVIIAAIVEDCVSLIVCNIPVMVTSIFRIRRKTHQGTAVGSQVRFASHHPNSGAGETLHMTSSTTLGENSWTNNFRWARELRGPEEFRDRDVVIPVLPNSEAVRTGVVMHHSDASGKASLAIERSEIDIAIEFHSQKLSQ
ncbi:hypothetical protein FPV67DRAFT_1411081, partial [Lyophyllum atratum]